MPNNLPQIAIVIPCYNEQEVLPQTNSTLTGLLKRMILNEEISDNSYLLYVDDGSSDLTWHLIEKYASESKNVQGVKLSANSGHQNALIAGLDTVADCCDAAISIDSDLQDDIEAIPQMVAKYREGYDIVYGVRNSRESDTWFKRESAQSFYRLMKGLGVKSVYNHADFRLMSAEAIKDFLKYDERNIFIRGIIPRLGRNQTSVYYDRKPRQAGESKYPLKKMLNFAVDGITSFSVRPVRMVFFLGLGFLLVALGIFIYVMIRYFGGETIEGWTSLMLSIWFCSGVILMSLGMIGEYIGKIYTEVKHRPRYSIEQKSPTKK